MANLLKMLEFAGAEDVLAKCLLLRRIADRVLRVGSLHSSEARFSNESDLTRLLVVHSARNYLFPCGVYLSRMRH